MTIREIARGRMIFKVLIVGNDLPLQTGFLSRASGDCISYQLYNTLGVTLGVSRFDFPQNLNVILQLWSLPSTERVSGLTKSYVKGHRAIIIVVRPDEVGSIPELLQDLSLSTETLFMVVITGSVREAEEEINKLEPFLNITPHVHAFQNVDDAVKIVSDHLVNRRESKGVLPIIGAIPEGECPPFEPQPPASATPPNSDDEVEEIREIALDLGLRIVGDFCAVELSEGSVWIDLRTGASRIEPDTCRFCTLSCKRKSNLCIVGTDSGWSSQNLRSRALLTIAKIHGLLSRTLPINVERQIHSASACSKFILNPEVAIEEIPDGLLAGLKRSESRMSLLKVAKERVNEGRLSEAGYSMLKKKLHNLETSRS